MSVTALYWGLRAVADTVQGYNKRESAREKAAINRFDVREAAAIDAEYHEGLAAVDKTVDGPPVSQDTPLRGITVHYRMLGGTHRTTGAGTSAFPIIAPTSHWGVQVGDYFYELRRKRDRGDDVLEDGSHEPIDVQEEGDKVNLAMTRDRVIVDGTKSVDIAETKLSDAQIRGRAVYIFKRLFASDYNVLIDNCQSFAIFLCESILDETERHAVKEKLQSKSTLYSNVAGSVALSVGYYLAAGLSKDADDMLSGIGSLSTEGGKRRVEGWKEGMHEAVDRKLETWDNIYLHPEVFHVRRMFYSNVLSKVGDGLHGLGRKMDAGAESLHRFADS